MNRRQLIFALMLLPAMRGMAKVFDEEHDSEGLFRKMIDLAQQKRWTVLPIGELMGHLAMDLQGTPYVGGTLEGEGPEICRVDLLGLDCVTYFENVLCMARILKKGKYSFDDYLNEITYTRYRNGKLNGYTSRLHYTAEWFHDNIVKGVVRDVTEELNGLKFEFNDHFMTAHPKYYKPLMENPEMLRELEKIEKNINSIPRFFVPKNAIAPIEHKLRTGDIVGVATSKDGLDYAHTGMIYVDANKVARFLHASTTKKKVTLDVSVSEYVNSVSSHTGITVVRPLEPDQNGTH